MFTFSQLFTSFLLLSLINCQTNDSSTPHSTVKSPEIPVTPIEIANITTTTPVPHTEPPSTQTPSPTFTFSEVERLPERLLLPGESFLELTNATFDENLTINGYPPSAVCAADEYQCAFSLECLPLVWCCDHVIDCSDGSDEWPHFRPPPDGAQVAGKRAPPQCSLCSVQTYHCPASGECIPRGWLCDSQPDCGQTELGPDSGDEVNELCLKMGTLLLEPAVNLTLDTTNSPSNPSLFTYNQTHLLRTFSLGNSTIETLEMVELSDRENVSISTLLSVDRNGRLCWLHQTAIVCRRLKVPGSERASRPLSPPLPVVYPRVNTTSALPVLALEVPMANQPIGALPPPPPITTTTTTYPFPPYIVVSSLRQPPLYNHLTATWYLLDSHAELLYLCTGNLSACTVIVDYTALSRPLALALDPSEGALFLSRHGDRSRFGPASLGPALLRCSLDGDSLQTLVDVRLVEPGQLALDVTERKVYWIDTYLNILEQINYDGTNRQQIKLSNSGPSLSAWSSSTTLLAHDNHLYLTFGTTGKGPQALDVPMSLQIVTINMEHRQYISRLITDSSASKATLLLDQTDSSLSKLMKLLCEKCTALTSSLCVPSFDYTRKQSITAACLNVSSESGDYFDTNNRSLLVYSRGEPGVIQLTHPAYPPIAFSKCPTLFDISPLTGTIYYLDDCNQRLYYHGLFKQTQSPPQSIHLPDFALHQLESLSVDWLGDNLYLIDSGSSSIKILAIKGETDTKTPSIYLKELLTDLSSPKALVVDPQNGLLFFSQYGHHLYEEDSGESPEKGVCIKRANMDGSGGRLLLSAPYLKFPNSLTVDPGRRRLYWVDAFYHRIERIDYDGGGRIQLVAGLRIGIANSLSLDLVGQILYWTELQHGTIQAFELSSNLTTVVRQEKAPLYRVKSFTRILAESANQEFGNGTETKQNLLCEQLRLQTPDGPVCACADGFVKHSKLEKCIKVAAKEAEPLVESNPCNSTLDPSVPCSQPVNDSRPIECSRKHFYCADRRRCLPYHWQCDGHKECPDRSDEAPVNDGCFNGSCPPDMFRCARRQICIHTSWRCDRVRDCGPDDDSDERDCGEQEEPPKFT